MSPALVLHWPLDALTPEGLALDASPNNLNGTADGGPENVPDPRFGTCLRFDGVDDHVYLPDTPALRVRAYTVEAWVNLATPKTMYGLLSKLSTNLRLVVNQDGSLAHRFATAAKPDDGHATGPGALTAGTWRHVAVTNDGQVARIFLDGGQVAEYAFPGGRVADQTALVVAGAKPAMFPGRVAHVRIYDGALTALEIKRDMADDEAALESFVRSHPIDFAFVNGDEQPVLFIDEAPAGQPMTLELVNSSRTAVEPLSVPALSATSFHFALRFRKGTLAAGIEPQVAAAGWALLAEPDGTALYLRWKEPKPIAPGASVRVPLTGLNADGADGTHGTRVELEFRQLRYAGQTAELTGTRLQFLDIVNHRGRRDIPLDLRLVGGDRVLSDGVTSCSLRLHLTNVMHDGPGIPLPATKPPATFVVSFDAQGETALTPAGDAESVTLTISSPGWDKHPELLGQRMQWTLIPTADTVLPPDGYLELTLDGVRGLPSPGHAPIAVDYRDIPGYANGTFTVPVERTPLLYTDRAVTIGMVPDPGAAPPVPRLQVVHANQNANGNTLVLGPTTQSNLRLGYHQDYSWIQSHGGRPLAINPVGNNVSIGMAPATADAKVSVSAGGSHLQLRRESGMSGGGNVLFLELYQDTSAGSWVTYPSIRFHHGNKFWHRIEGRPEGFLFKVGDTAGDGLVDVYAAAARVSGIHSPGADPLVLNPGGNNVRIGTATTGDGKVSIAAAGSHLQLRREASLGGGGKVLFLELFQDTTAGTAVTYPSIRFHHGNKFWNRIEGRPEGFLFKGGDLGYDNMADVYAGTAVVSGLRIGSVAIGENELYVLKRLAAGQLEFDLYNVKQDEYAYAADYSPFDNDRRYVFTWRPKGRINQGRWRITYPS
jgi:hypothetical protein